MKTDPDKLQTTKEAARRLGVSHQTLEKWRSQKRGPHYHKIGSKAVRYSQSDLDAFMMGGRHVQQ